MFGNNINCTKEIENLKDGLYQCPQCKGKGTIEKLSQSSGGCGGWVQQYYTDTCPLCKGEGYTEKQYRPHMVQQGWEEVK